MKVTPKYLAAIEAGCGGKLYGIGVENDNISKALLTKRCFDYFAQFFPVNTLHYKQIPDEIIQRAESIARRFRANIILPWNETVSSPVNPKFNKIHMFCVSNFLICDSLDAAAEIAKSRQVPCPIVTLDGEVFESSGEAAGGFRGEPESIPKKWFFYKDQLEAHREKDRGDGAHRGQLQEALRAVESERSDLLHRKEDCARALQRLERVRDKIQQYKGKAVADSSTKFATQLPILEEREKQEKEDLLRLKADIESAEYMLGQIQKGSDVKVMFLNNIKKLSEEEDKLNKEKDLAQKKLAENETIIAVEQKEIEEMGSKIKELDRRIDQLSLFIEERALYLQAEQAKVEEKKREFEDLQQKHRERAERDDGLKKQISEFETQRVAANEQIEGLNKQIATLRQDVNNAKDQLKDDPSLITAPFRRDEQLEKIKVKDFERDLNTIQDKYYQLDKQINKDVESQRNRMEVQMQELASKEQILKNDKDQIYNNLEQLDEKSQQSVMQCFEFVNK
jgi:chromosome segregation ATPase